MLIVFWCCVAVVLYVYCGYPLLLRGGALGRRQESVTGAEQPLISIIVAAHNEESVIEAKLRNLLASNYPRDRTEILIGSDGSSDRTEEIVRPYMGEGVGLISFPKQQGKSAMQNGLVAASSGTILVFTDADCLSPAGAIPRLIEHFADPRVGLVTGRPHFENGNESRVRENESMYLRYETWLREQESARGLLAMASGSLFAIRRSLWRPLDKTLGDDFVLPLQVAEAGYRNILEARAVSFTRLAQGDVRSMLQLKIRIISKDFRALLAHRSLLDPLRHGGIALSLWSHKLLRWFIPYFLIVMLGSSVFLLERPFIRAAFAAQASFYLLAFFGLLLRISGERGGSRLSFLWSLPLSFCVVNLAALLGTLKCLAGRTSGQWKPERRHLPA